jgi:hypothetical protein
VKYFPSHIFRQYLLLLLAIAASTGRLTAQRLIVSAPDHRARLPEVIEIPLKQVREQTHLQGHFKAVNAATHEELATQIDSHPSGSVLLIAVQIPAQGFIAIDFLPADEQYTSVPQVFGREAPERKDDFAWENKFVAYRVYGPALEATGEITSGIDVWSKRVPNFVIDSFYKHDAEGTRTHNPALSYHKDDGVGLDSYLVGPTRGCGGTAILRDNKLWVSKNYTHLKQVSSGPVRFDFELTYAPWNAGGIEVTETKRITLDAGSHLNKIESTFTFAGTSTIDAAAGLAIHPGADFAALNAGRFLSVWDTPQDPSAGRIATGLLSDSNQKSSVVQIDNQALLVTPIHSGESISYYAGSGWSKADMPTQQAWNAYLEEKLTELQHPLQTQWKQVKPRP